MGWNGASHVMSQIIETTEELVANYQTRVELYKNYIEILENEDADTLEECLGESDAYDEAFKHIHPNSELEYQDYEED